MSSKPSSSASSANASTTTTATTPIPMTVIGQASTSQRIDRSMSPRQPVSMPTTLSEWQLMAVLKRANLLQYYDVFISQGGDDINQIMSCDEQEFLEIMSLVGMLSKPLHVRRLQRALSDYSKDQTSFHLNAIQEIGPPPPVGYQLKSSSSMTEAMSMLMPGLVGSFSSNSSDVVESSPNNGSTEYEETSSRATANIISGHNIGLSFCQGGMLTPSTSTVLNCVKSSARSGDKEFHNDFVSLGDFDPNNPSPTENPVLSKAQINRLTECAIAASKKLPPLEPRLVQNKKRISKEVHELLVSTEHTPNRVAQFRKFSAIYGRFDTKRKPHKVLTLHETTVNEAAAQLCLLVPALLTRRDELFPLARQVVKDAGYHYAKSRKRPCDPTDMHSPVSSPSNSPPPGLAEQGFEHFDAKRVKEENSSDSPLEQWATEVLSKMSEK